MSKQRESKTPKPLRLSQQSTKQQQVGHLHADLSLTYLAEPTIHPGLTQESVIELNHLNRISPKIGLKPFVQLILNHGSSGRFAQILVSGLEFLASL